MNVMPVQKINYGSRRSLIVIAVEEHCCSGL